RRSLRGRQISRLVSCVRPLFFGHDLCPDRLSLPVQPIPGGWSWDRTAARWRCTRPHHAPASWTRWRHTAYDRLRPVSCTGASSSVRFSVHRRPCCAPIRCCAPIQGLDIIISYSLKIRKLFSSRSLALQGRALGRNARPMAAFAEALAGRCMLRLSAADEGRELIQRALSRLIRGVRQGTQLDWLAADDLPARLGLERVRAGLQAREGVRSILRALNSANLERISPDADVDRNRLAGVVVALRAAVEPLPAGECDSWASIPTN